MAWWLGRKAAEPVRPLVPVWLTGEAETGGFVRGYQAQLDEVYRRNPVGLRAVRLVSGLVGGLPLFVEEGSPEAIELIRSGGLLERAAASLLLHGNAYAQLSVDGRDRPAELHSLRPERVSVVCGANGWPSAYLYRVGPKAVRIAREDPLGRRQVAHLKALNPGDDHYGLGCLDAAIGAASVDPHFGRDRGPSRGVTRCEPDTDHLKGWTWIKPPASRCRSSRLAKCKRSSSTMRRCRKSTCFSAQSSKGRH